MMKILHQEYTKFYLKISSCADVEQLDTLFKINIASLQQIYQS